MLAPSVAHLGFQRDDGLPLEFVPGQFLQVHFHYGDGTPTKRSYSLATRNDIVPAGDGDAVEIAVSYVPGGAATALFEGLEIGDRVQASGPFGRFCLQPGDTNARYLLIATGTGVTPYRAMLPQLQGMISGRGVEVVSCSARAARPRCCTATCSVRSPTRTPGISASCRASRGSCRRTAPGRPHGKCNSSWPSSRPTRA